MKTVITDSLTGREFLLEKELSKGKFGRVILVISKNNHAPFILKATAPLNPEVAAILQSLHHPALLSQAETILVDDTHYLLRPFQEGISLKEVISTRKFRKKFPVLFWVQSFIDLLEALDLLHNHRLIHRDIKPANILLTGNNHNYPEAETSPPLKLIDFEQALVFGSTMHAVRAPFALCYSPPEQLLNQNNLTGPWSDLFALALVLYEVICRKPAFWYHDPEMLLHLQLNQPLKKEKIPDGLFDILTKATSRIPFRLPPRRLYPSEVTQTIRQGIGQRYQCAGEMVADLKQFLNNYSAVR